MPYGSSAGGAGALRDRATRTSRTRRAGVRARARLAAAATLGPCWARTRLLFGAAADARALRRYGQSLNEGSALLIQAGIAHLRGRTERARAKLDAAAAHFDAVEARLWAASADYCAGRIEGGPAGHARSEAAARVLSDEGVRDPVRWAVWTASGFGQLLDGAP